MKTENIKFRGKSKCTGEWLYGDLVRNVEGAFAIVPPFEMTTDNLFDRYEVKEETIGQLISALRLTNGKIHEVFTDDIISCKDCYDNQWHSIVSKYGCITTLKDEAIHIDFISDFDIILQVAGNKFDDKDLFNIIQKRNEKNKNNKIQGKESSRKDLLEIWRLGI